jgi:hypothetical protein
LCLKYAVSQGIYSIKPKNEEKFIDSKYAQNEEEKVFFDFKLF